MDTTVEQDLTMHLVLDTEDAIPLPSRLTYAANDPYAVHTTFHADGDPVRWAFGRELLAEGTHQPCGKGDVRLWPPDQFLYIGLDSPTGRALIKAPLPVVSGWLHRTYHLVPSGSESTALGWDGDMSELFA